MSTAFRLAQAITVSPERCCAVLCEYRPEVVTIYHRMILGARRRHIDLTAELAGARAGDSQGRAPGVSTSIDIRTLRIVWDIQRVMAGGAKTVTEICEKLCPWSMEEE